MEDGRRAGAAAVKDDVVKMFWKVMSLELKQFSRVTSGTSFGSANSMSTHCKRVRSDHGQDGGPGRGGGGQSRLHCIEPPRERRFQ